MEQKREELGDCPEMIRSLAHLRKGKKARVRSGQGGDLGSDLLEPQRWNCGLRSGLWRNRLSWRLAWRKSLRAASVGEAWGAALSRVYMKL